MFSIEENIFMVIIIGEFIVGMLGNGYIGLVNWIDWIKKKEIFLIDYIFISLVVFRICLICVMVLNVFIIVFYLEVYENDKIKIVNIFWIFINYLSMWFVICFNVFYFFKVVNFFYLFFF